jgi:dihydroorotate dehydrogenase (NAD+) catalytic subunit
MAVEVVVDLAASVGSLRLPNPVMTASGTAGHGAEFQSFFDLADLGAHVVKSLAAFEWQGNPPPRVHPAGLGMINAVGLQGPGIAEWLRHDLPVLAGTGARIVVSIWGRSVDEYRQAAEMLAAASASIVAVEVNLSCPNLEGRRGIFAHDPELSAEVIRSTAACNRPRWAKLSANTDRVVEVAGAVADAGAEAVTLVNTLLGMVIDQQTRRPVLGTGGTGGNGGGTGGGYSGRPVHPVAVRAIFDVHAALPHVPIVGVGGVASGWDAVEMILAGASAVQVGTANFVDPRAPIDVLAQVRRWCSSHGVAAIAELVGAAHGAIAAKGRVARD